MPPEDQIESTVDFSPIAARYDATRDLPEEILLICYDRLIERGLFPGRGTYWMPGPAPRRHGRLGRCAAAG
jgi:hypothetical protein